MSMSNIVETNMLNYILKTPGGDTSVIRPSTAGLVFIALFTDPDGLTTQSLETNQGTGAVIPYELSGNGYQRQRIYFNNLASGGQIRNSLQVDFPVATGSWGTITHYALLNIGITDFPGTLFWGTFNTPIQIPTGYRFVIKANSLVVSLD
jgi:hypothetical protein